MSFRDGGSGEGSPPERQPNTPWVGPDMPLPAATNNSVSAGGHSTAPAPLDGAPDRMTTGLTPHRGLEPPYGSERSRTPSRRRAVERGQDEPVDAYLPRWALESGVRRADGGGRHAAPDDDDDVEPPYSGGGWQAGANGGWHREGDRRER